MQEWSCCCCSTPWPLLSSYWTITSSMHYLKSSTRSNQEREMAEIAISLHDEESKVIVMQEWSCCCCSTPWPLLSSYWNFTSSMHYVKSSTCSNQEREMAEIAIPLHKRSDMHRHAKVIMLLLQHAMSTTLIVLEFHKWHSLCESQHKLQPTERERWLRWPSLCTNEAACIVKQKWSCCCCSTPWALLSSYWNFTSDIHYAKASTSSNQEREMAEIAIPLHKTKRHASSCKNDHAAATACHEHYSSSYWTFTSDKHYVKTSKSSDQERGITEIAISLHKRSDMHRHAIVMMLL